MAKKNYDDSAFDDIVFDTTIPEGTEVIKVVGGMSDTAIQVENDATPEPAEQPETVIPAGDIPTTQSKGFIYRPMRVQTDILDRAEKATGLQQTDVIAVALILLQNATLPELRAAISAHSGDKAEALLNALKGKS